MCPLRPGMARLSTIRPITARKSVLRCPACKKLLEQSRGGYVCRACSIVFPIIDGIPALVDHTSIPQNFDASAFEFLFNMEQKHFWHIGRKEMILDVLRRNIPKLTKSRMLEVGCGNGSILAFLRQNGINIEGGDIFLEGLAFCRQRASSIALYQIDALSLPFHNDYEIVGIFDVLEHIENDDKALAEINRALKAGGNLILTVPAHKFLWSRHDEASHHKRRYSKMELIAKLERYGFVVNKATYYMFFLFPVLAAMRLLTKIFRNKKYEKDYIKTSLELKTIPVINNVFLASLRLEKYLIRYLNLPFGASLLILAAKKDEKR